MDSGHTYGPELDNSILEIPDIEQKLDHVLGIKGIHMGNYFSGREELEGSARRILEKYGLLETMSLCEKYLENEALIKKTNETILLINVSCTLESANCYLGYTGMESYYASKPFYERLDGCEKKKEQLEQAINGVTNGNLEKMLEVYETYKEFI